MIKMIVIKVNQISVMIFTIIISFIRIYIKIHTFQLVKKKRENKCFFFKMVKIIFTTIGKGTMVQ